MEARAASRPERRASSGGRRRRWPLVASAAVLVLAGAAVASAYQFGPGQVERAEIKGLVPAAQPQVVLAEPQARAEPDAPPPPAILTVLLVGLDSREGLSEEERRELSSGDFEGSRADSIMLAQLRTDGSAGALLSIPRDLRVTRCDGSVGRINAAFSIGERLGEEGGSCLVSTVHDLTGIGVNHYVELDFAGFVEVIDALGGVELCPPEPLFDTKAGLDLEAGCQHVDSVQALAFARARSIDDDFGRMQRQQQLVKALLDETTAGGFGSDVTRTVRVLRRVADAVRTDDGLGLTTMRDLAVGMQGLGSDRLVTYQVPSDPRTVGGIAYVIAREDEAESLYSSFRDGTVLSKAAAQAADRG